MRSIDGKSIIGGIYQNGLSCGNNGEEQPAVVIKRHLDTVLAMSALTVRSLKRFVKEHKENIEKGIVLNPYGTNLKALFMFYLIFLCGITEDQINSFKDLETFVMRKFSSRSIKISGELCREL